MLNFQRHSSYFILLTSYLLLASCSIQKQISRSAKEDVLSNKALTTAHVGISIFDPSANKYLYNYQGDKYFVPASNTKLPTCYAAMKYLGDSLVSFYVKDTADEFLIIPAGDPTFLHPEFLNQRFFYQLKSIKKQIVVLYHTKSNVSEYGSGWSWDDYQEPYLAERAEMPIYGNVIHFERVGEKLIVTPPILKRPFFDEPMMQLIGLGEKFKVTRNRDENKFRFWKSEAVFNKQDIPFKTFGLSSGTVNFLADTLGKHIPDDLTWSLTNNSIDFIPFHSQPTDSLLKPMMHRSDNFFAEQSLLMVSNEMLGVMNDEKIIDTLLKTDFKDLPQKPRWVDGSGLSRYNLFTPQDFVAILNKMKNEFGMERIKVILPTGGEGTISNYYKEDSGFIYAKTGTLSGVVAFSGFLYTKKGKLLIFSTLVNNHNSSATEIRKAVEKFLQGIRNSF